jgi:hypothetical protein
MSLTLSVKSLTASMRRLEAAARKGPRHCPECRREGTRSLWEDPALPPPCPEDMITVKCEICHFECIVNLAGKSEHEREFLLIAYSIRLEDTYREPKAHATSLWLCFLRRARKTRARRQKPVSVGLAGSEIARLDTASRRLASKLEAVSTYIQNKQERMLVAKYGEYPFPEHYTLIEEVKGRANDSRRVAPNVEGLEQLEAERIDYLVCAELEKIVWGETRPRTLVAIDKIGQEIDELVTKAEKEKKMQSKSLDPFGFSKDGEPCDLDDLPEWPTNK